MHIGDEYDVVLRPASGWMEVDVAGIWRYRDLVAMLVRRDFVAKYKQTILGPAWFIAQPTLTAVVFTLIFGKAIGLSTDGLPPMLFYLAGQLGWNYFAANVTVTSGALVANLGLLSKVYFPRLVIPIASVISNVLTLVLELAVFGAFYVYFKFVAHAPGFGPAGSVFLLPALILQTALLSLGVGLLIAAATAKYRDLAHLTALLVQLWMFATPVIYPTTQLSARFRWVLALNPMAPMIESYRLLLLGSGTVGAADLMRSTVITAIVLLAGVALFTRVERNFVDIA
jgi:lipopolysaccharide transport system permease protein